MKFSHIITIKDLEDIKNGYFELPIDESIASFNPAIVRVLVAKSNRFCYTFLESNKLLINDLYELFFEKLKLKSKLYFLVKIVVSENEPNDIEFFISDKKNITLWNVTNSPLLSANFLAKLKVLVASCEH